VQQPTLRTDIVRKDGTHIPVEVRVGIVPDIEKTVIATVRDISSRLEAKSEIQRQRYELARLSRIATIGALSGSLAHEISQPLAAILANAQAGELTLDRSKGDRQLLLDIFADIVGDAKRIRDVISNLRAMQSNQDMEISVLNVNALVNTTLRLLRGEFRRQGMEVCADLAVDLPDVKGSEVALQQVMLNLLTNAMQSYCDLAPDRRVLTVQSLFDDSQVIVSISDRGSGISDEDGAQVFEPFFTRKAKGLGLGLMICRRIIEEHGGRIWFENNVSNGVTFFVSLPRAGT
jgi:C4-dicarboxylate-specific signal transduction histidine kinase